MSDFNSTVTREMVARDVRCDPDTGLVYWARAAPRRTLSGRAGGLNQKGYWMIQMFGTRVATHRLIWFWVHGVWPKGHLDHINGDRGDNRIVNLREVTQRVNLQNMRKPGSRNTTGFLGVYRRGETFNACIRTDGKKLTMSGFPTAEAAYAAYVEAKRRLHEGCTL